MFFFFFFNDTATPEIYPLSLHDALPILRARERGVPAERDFHRRREPAEPIAAVFLMEECRLGEVHLCRHVLHPALVARRGEDAHARGVAAERATRECVHLHDPQAHALKVASLLRGWRGRVVTYPTGRSTQSVTA